MDANKIWAVKVVCYLAAQFLYIERVMWMKKKLLIIDHQEVSRAFLRNSLAAEYEILEAEDGFSAWKMLESETDIQVVVLELLLPKMNGLEFLQLIRNSKSFQNLVVVIVTSFGEPSDEVTALGIGADDYICKPYTAEVISARIRNIVNNKDVLKNSESRFGLQRNILDATVTAIYVVDAVNYNLLYANSSAIKLLNCPSNIYTSKKCFEFFFNRNHPCKHCKLVVAHSQKNKADIFISSINKTVRARINMMEWLGRPAYVIYMVDITEEKRASELAEERYQKELKRRYRVDLDFMAYLVINVTKGTVLEHDPHGFPVPTISPGQPAYEFTERVLPTVIDFEKRREFAEMLSLENLRKAYAEGRTVLSIDYRRYSRNEKYIMWARSTIQLMLDPQTKDLMAFLYTYDINENKMLQDIINASVYCDYNMLAYLNVYTGKAKLYAQNNALLKREIKQEFVYTEAVREYLETYIGEKERNAVWKKMELERIIEELRNKFIYEFDIEIIDADGELKRRRIRYANFDKVYGMVLWTEMDITHIIQPEQQQQELLLEEIENLAALNDIKTRYLSTVSYELRTPLRNINSRLKNVLSKCNDEELQGQLREVQEYIGRIAEVLNDVMDISNLENQKMKIDSIQFTLSDLLAKIKSSMKKKYGSDAANLNIEQQIFHDACLSDYRALTKILSNILDNAFRHSNQSISVSLLLYELPSESNEKGNFRFIIKDNGVGIRPERLENIFQPFANYVNSKTRSSSSGLGLAITKGIVDKLGGKISIASEVGVGTTVTVDVALQLAGTLAEKSHRIRDAERSISGLRVLLVEDVPMDVLVSRRLLEKKGTYVYMAESHEKVWGLLDSCSENKFDCIVLDLDGIEDISKYIMQLRNHKNIDFDIPIIGICKQIDMEDRHRYLEKEVNDILLKPLRFAQLMESITKLCLN